MPFNDSYANLKYAAGLGDPMCILALFALLFSIFYFLWISYSLSLYYILIHIKIVKMTESCFKFLYAVNPLSDI